MSVSKIYRVILLLLVVGLFPRISLAASVIGPGSGCIEPLSLPTTGSGFNSAQTTNFGAPFDLQVYRGPCTNNGDLLTYVRIVPDNATLPVSLCADDYTINYDGSIYSGFQFVSEFSVTPAPACQTVSSPTVFILDQSTALATFDSNKAFTLLYFSLQSESASVAVQAAATPVPVAGSPVAHVENSNIVAIIGTEFGGDDVCFENDGNIDANNCDNVSGAPDEGYIFVNGGNWVGGATSTIKGCGVASVDPVSSAICPTTNTDFAICSNNGYVLVQTTKSNHYFAIKANADCTAIAKPEATGIVPCRTNDSFDPSTGCFAGTGSAPLGGSLDENIKMALGLPQDNSNISGLVTVNGWAAAPAGIKSIIVLIDGEEVASIPPADTRFDIAQLYPSYPGSLHSGFSVRYNFSNQTDGQHIVRVYAYDKSGNYNLKIANVKVTKYTGGWAPASDVSFDGVSIESESNYMVIKGVKFKGRNHSLLFTWDQTIQNPSVISTCDDDAVTRELCTIDAVPAATLLLP